MTRSPWRLVVLLVLLAHVALAASLPACGGATPRETVVEGRVTQFVDHRRYGVLPRLDLVVVLGTSNATDGAALRKGVAKAVRDQMHAFAEGDWFLRDLWNPVDVRAFVASAVDGSIRSPTQIRGLAWSEPDATGAGADAFAAAVELALGAAPEGEVPAGAILETLRHALAVADTAAEAARVIVLASTSDDASVLPRQEPAIRRGGTTTRDEVTVVLPSAIPAAIEALRCARAAAPSLERWANANDARIDDPCSGISLNLAVGDPPSHCLPHPPAPAPAGQTACRLRALVPPGTLCDPVRGWRVPAVPIAPPLDPGLAEMEACEVVALVGDDATLCRRLEDPYVGAASGWCLPAPSRGCTTSAPRLVGGAAAPFALIEVACELSP